MDLVVEITHQNKNRKETKTFSITQSTTGAQLKEMISKSINNINTNRLTLTHRHDKIKDEDTVFDYTGKNKVTH